MRRTFGLFVVVGAFVPLVFTASVSAQGAVLLAQPQVATPGQAVTITGSGFSSGDVNLRLATRDGASVGAATVDTSGRLSTVIEAPAAVGHHLIIGVMVNPNGRQRAFTPGRTRLRVVAAAGAGAAAPPQSGGLPSSPVLWIAALGLLAGVLTFAAGRQRTLHRRRQPLAAHHVESSR